MKWIGVFGVLCFAAVPAFGDACVYTFDVVDGEIVITVTDEGSTVLGLGGTFDVTIYESDGHIDSSDTFVLSSSGIYNTTAGEIELAGGYITASVDVGDLELLDFDANYPAGGVHIGEGGTFCHSSGAHISAQVLILLHFPASITTTTLVTVGSEVVHIDGYVTTSAGASDTIEFYLEVLASSITFTLESNTYHLTLDVTIEGTAHASPDPALGGLVALGLGGAGTWLRRRRHV